MDEPSLSPHEQRILEEIERNLMAEDLEFVRRVREARPRGEAVRLLRLGVLGMVCGLALLLVSYTRSLAGGVAGFLLMLAGVVGAGLSIRQLAGSGRSLPAAVKELFQRASARLRDRRGRG